MASDRLILHAMREHRQAARVILRGMRLVWAGAIVLGATALGCLAQPGDAPAPIAGPYSPAHSLPPTAATISSCLVPGCDATAFVVDAIDGAKAEIRGQAYNFTSQPIVDALVRAKGRGVDVEMLLDKISPCQKGEGADQVAAAGIPVMIDSRPRIAHNKVLIIDRDRVILGSFNFSVAAMKNAEDTNLVTAPAVAQHYLAYWQVRQAAATAYGDRAHWCHTRSS